METRDKPHMELRTPSRPGYLATGFAPADVILAQVRGKWIRNVSYLTEQIRVNLSIVSDPYGPKMEHCVDYILDVYLLEFLQARV